LLPPSLKEWLPEGHLAYFISDVVDNLDISEIEKEYEKELRGYPPYHPRMMLKVLIYGYSTGVRSSRKLEKKIQEDIAFRMLAAGNMPDFRTIAAFRRRHLKAFKKLFVEVLKLCQKAGLVKLGHVALDGTKVKANASKHKAMSYERMKKKEAELEKEIEELIAAAEKTDQREDKLYGKDKRGDELPKELAIRESWLKKIREAKAALEEEARKEREAKYSSKQNDKDDNQDGAAAGEAKEPCEPKPAAQRNFTDPDSKIMPAPGGGWIQGYNAQAAVDSANQIILAAQVSSNPSDRSQLKSMVKALEENMGEKPERHSQLMQVILVKTTYAG